MIIPCHYQHPLGNTKKSIAISRMAKSCEADSPANHYVVVIMIGLFLLNDTFFCRKCFAQCSETN